MSAFGTCYGGGEEAWRRLVVWGFLFFLRYIVDISLASDEIVEHTIKSGMLWNNIVWMKVVYANGTTKNLLEYVCKLKS